MVEEPESGERGPQQHRKEMKTARKLLKHAAQPKICELVHANIYSLSQLQETHSKATALGGDVKMKDDVRTHKMKVKEKENMWYRKSVNMKEK